MYNQCISSHLYHKKALLSQFFYITLILLQAKKSLFKSLQLSSTLKITDKIKKELKNDRKTGVQNILKSSKSQNIW